MTKRKLLQDYQHKRRDLEGKDCSRTVPSIQVFIQAGNVPFINKVSELIHLRDQQQSIEILKVISQASLRYFF